MPLGIIEVIVLLALALPFFINTRLAKSRGTSVATVILLTLLFSWVVTLILTIMPAQK